MIKGETKSGFKYKIADARLNNYELLESLADLDDNSLAVPKVVDLLLGKEQTKKLKDHLRDKEGLVDSEKMTVEIMEIFESQKDLKNSQSLPE